MPSPSWNTRLNSTFAIWPKSVTSPSTDQSQSSCTGRAAHDMEQGSRHSLQKAEWATHQVSQEAGQIRQTQQKVYSVWTMFEEG